MSALWRTSATVLLAHAGMVWLMVHRLTAPSVPGAHEQVILASVVTGLPQPVPARTAQPTQPAPAATLRPVAPRPLPAPSQTTSQSLAVQQQAAASGPATVPTESAPGNSAAPTFSAVATVPASAGSVRPTSTAAGSVVLPSSDADELNNPPPAYPRMSRRMGEQGTVLVRVFISAEGRAGKAEIRTSSGYARLDEAALETVQRWRFVPGKRAGQPEAMWFNVPIRFVLD